MNREIGRLFLVILFIGAFATSALAAPYFVPVTFTQVTNTAYGQSVFVVGSIPQLGNWSVTAAVKLVPGNCTSSNCVWTATIGIPEGTSYEYKFVKRDDCATCLSNAANVVWEPGANRTGSTPAGLAAPFNGKSVFYYSGWTNPSIVFSNWSTGWTSKVMTAFANGRTAGEKIWRADGINLAGQTDLLFVFSDNNGHYDNPDGVSGQNYSTPLDAFVVQDGQVFNYWPAPAIAAPWVESFSLAPTNGLQTRTVRLYLPRGFTNNLAKRYPVLYMNDGQNLFLGQGNFGGWNADTNATFLIRSGRMRELIIVGVDNTSDRTCEYNPCNLGSCGASNSLAPRYVDFIINQLKPFIDAQYPTTAGRTLTDPDNTGIVGSSRGGLCAMWFAWEHPEVFHKVGGLSPSFWGCDTTKNNLALAPKRPLRIYLDSGSVGDFPTTDPVCNPCYDGELYTVTARDNLLNNGYLLNVDLMHWISYGDQHNESYWNRRLPVCYQFLFPTSDEPNTILDTVSPLRITGFQFTNNNFTVTWPGFQRRAYSVLGCSNLDNNLSNWTTLYSAPAEARPWNYLTAPPTNGFQFFRVREEAVPYWPN
jgi:predicted alpha/beta superfamily hydrolase